MFRNKKIIRYQDVKIHLNEGDVALFKGKTIFSWFVKKAGEGEYSHVGLLSWHNKNIELVEFKEGNPIGLLFGMENGTGGGRSVNFETQVKKHSGRIDIYRFVPEYYKLSFDNEVKLETVYFDGECLTEKLRKMTGLPYGWKTIWEFLKYNMFGLRMIYNTSRKFLDDDYINQNYPVCSTAVALAARECYVDLVPNRSDISTEPSDIARSAVLQYLFTLEW